MFHRSIIRLATFLSFLEISRADVFQRSFEIFEKEYPSRFVRLIFPIPINLRNNPVCNRFERAARRFEQWFGKQVKPYMGGTRGPPMECQTVSRGERERESGEKFRGCYNTPSSAHNPCARLASKR